MQRYLVLFYCALNFFLSFKHLFSHNGPLIAVTNYIIGLNGFFTDCYSVYCFCFCSYDLSFSSFIFLLYLFISVISFLSSFSPSIAFFLFINLLNTSSFIPSSKKNFFPPHQFFSGVFHSLASFPKLSPIQALCGQMVFNFRFWMGACVSNIAGPQAGPTFALSTIYSSCY